MSFLSSLGFGSNVLPGAKDTELPNIYPFPFQQAAFVDIDVECIYARILTDTLERTNGIPKKAEASLFDNCLASEVQEGLVTMLARAMTHKQELFVVFDPAIPVLRKANDVERAQIMKDYKDGRAESSVGVYISFKKYHRSDLVRLYSALEYCSVGSLYKNMNLASAIQLKINGLRSDVGLNDSVEPIEQAKAIATGLKKGQDVLLDKEDVIETAKPDTDATEKSTAFIDRKRSFYLGMPASYLTGISSKGLGDSGIGDAKAVERGLKGYFHAVIKPVIKAVFKADVTFKSEDFDQIMSSLEALKTMDVTSEEYMSKENKTELINKVFGLPDGSVGDAPAPIETAPPIQAPASRAPAPPVA